MPSIIFVLKIFDFLNNENCLILSIFYFIVNCLSFIYRPTIGFHPDVFSSDGTFKPNTSIKDNKNTKVESNFPIGFEDFINVNNQAPDTSRVRFANGRKTSPEFNIVKATAPSFEDINVAHQENFAIFDSHFPNNITITVEEYRDNENIPDTKNDLKSGTKSNRLRNIVQELVESR